MIGVGGCVASQEGDAILKRAPYVDLVFGPQTLHRLPEMIEAKRASRQTAGRHHLPGNREVRPPAGTARRRPDRFRVDHGRLLEVLQRSAWCPIPAAKKSRGRSTTSCWKCVQLAQQGVREVNLLGQNVNAYRGAMRRRRDMADLAIADPRHRADRPASAASATPPRIRWSSPTRLIEAHRDVPKLASYLHLPVQSGSDRILSAMKRNHTALEYKAQDPQAASRQTRHLHQHRHHRRLPGRNRHAISRPP